LHRLITVSSYRNVFCWTSNSCKSRDYGNFYRKLCSYDNACVSLFLRLLLYSALSTPDCLRSYLPTS
jgi:hypothetical protein